jgi:glutamyl-tRNA synthetase
VDGRYAPSPTGSLHVGNLRTALLAWLFARSAGSRFLIRVEDLDSQRVRAGCEEEQLADLRAIGLDWDGEVVRQSERLGSYDEAIARLGDRVYPCYCTRAEIRHAASAPHGPPVEGFYPGTCRSLTAAERAEREAAGRRPALRLRAGGERVAFSDRLAGALEGWVDDFVVRRNDGAPAYNLAVVVDDAAQGVREVVRGADLLDSTPRHLLLARLLGFDPPAYAHVPLVLGPDGARLAKRHGSVTLADRLARGETVADVVAWMAATTGQAEPGAAVTAADLVERFDPARVPREPTTFAPD